MSGAEVDTASLTGAILATTRAAVEHESRGFGLTRFCVRVGVCIRIYDCTYVYIYICIYGCVCVCVCV